MKNLKSAKWLIVLLCIFLILSAIIISLFTGNKKEETGEITQDVTEEMPTFANTTLFIKPAETISQKVGDILSAELWFQAENDTKVDGLQTVVCYGNELSLSETDGAIANEAAGLSMELISINNMDSNQSCATLVLLSNRSADELVTSANAVTLNFSVVKPGTGSITIDKDKSMVTGDNQESATVKSLAITSAQGTNYDITE